MPKKRLTKLSISERIFLRTKSKTSSNKHGENLHRKEKTELNKILSSYAALIGFLTLIIILALATFVQAQQAQNIETWTGAVSFTLKLTTNAKDTSGNKRFVTSNESFEGRMNFYTNEQGPTQGPRGCFLELLANDDTICITDFAAVNTLSKKSGRGSVLIVGSGNITATLRGTQVTGPSYINGKGSVEVDSSGINLISLRLGGTVGGGNSQEEARPFFFTGNIPVTALTKSQCMKNEDCNSNEFCLFQEGRCSAPGTCRLTPLICPLAPCVPVCGYDHVVYCSQCDAYRSGVSILPIGQCQ